MRIQLRERKSTGDTRVASLGFTIVEVLVAVAIIGLLLAIGLPALGRAREAARVVDCKNHLRQIGIALQNHHSQFGQLPQDGENGYGYGAFLLASLDQGPLEDRLKASRVPLPDPSTARPELEGTILPVFRCPSHSASEHLDPSGYARSEYIGNSELLSTATRLTDVLDGESMTIAVGETTSDQAWALPGVAKCDVPPGSGGRFGSEHSGGAQYLMCDGAVRFISSNVDQATIRALGTPYGKDVVGEF